MLRLVAIVVALTAAACATAQTPAIPAPFDSQAVTPTNPAPMDRTPAGATGPVRNQIAQAGDGIVTIRYWKIRKGSFPQFLEASQTGVWPYFEKIGARVVGMWKVIPTPGQAEASPDYDEVYLTTRYASVEHWAATRNAARLGGDGPDYAAMQAALALRQSLTLETRVTFLQGVVGPLGPVYLPPTDERFTLTQ